MTTSNKFSDDMPVTTRTDHTKATGLAIDRAGHVHPQGTVVQQDPVVTGPLAAQQPEPAKPTSKPPTDIEKPHAPMRPGRNAYDQGDGFGLAGYRYVDGKVVDIHTGKHVGSSANDGNSFDRFDVLVPGMREGRFGGGR